MFDAVIKFDKSLFLYLNGFGSPTWDGFWSVITNEKTPIPLYVFILLVCLKVYGLRRSIWIILCMAVLVTASDQTSNLFKNILVKRLRPCHDEEISKYVRLVNNYCGGRYGYFSAHASNSFAFATFFGVLFWRRLKWLAGVLFIWAALTAYSRIYLGVHYPLDVLSGMVFGIFSATISVCFYKASQGFRSL